MILHGLRRSEGALEMERALGLIYQERLASLCTLYEDMHREGYDGCFVSWRDRAFIALCMDHEYLRPMLLRLEKAIQKIPRIVMEDQPDGTDKVYRIRLR